MAEAVVDVERLKLGPTKLWTGLVLHHKDVFVSHVIPKLNETDRWFFSEVNRESRGVLEYELSMRRFRSVLRATRVRKLLARKRVLGTNGRRIRRICRGRTPSPSVENVHLQERVHHRCIIDLEKERERERETIFC